MCTCLSAEMHFVGARYHILLQNKKNPIRVHNVYQLFLSISKSSIGFNQLPSASTSPVVRARKLSIWKSRNMYWSPYSIPGGTKYTYPNPYCGVRLLMDRQYFLPHRMMWPMFPKAIVGFRITKSLLPIPTDFRIQFLSFSAGWGLFWILHFLFRYLGTPFWASYCNLSRFFFGTPATQPHVGTAKIKI